MLLMQWSRESLREDIRDVIARADIVEFDGLILYAFPYIVISDVDMLRSIVVLGVVRESLRACVIQIYKLRFENLLIEL